MSDPKPPIAKYQSVLADALNAGPNDRLQNGMTQDEVFAKVGEMMVDAIWEEMARQCAVDPEVRVLEKCLGRKLTND